MQIDEIEGIGPEYASKLAAVGVTTTEELLDKGAVSAGRDRLTVATGIDAALILEWVNHADLMRINGVGSEYSDLLEAAGVDSPPELAQRNATNLAVTLQEVVAARPTIVRRIPSEAEVADWIDQAKALPRVVEHGGGGAAASAPVEAHVEAEAVGVAPAGSAHDHDHDHGSAGHDHGAADHDHGTAPTPAPAPSPREFVAVPAPTPAATGIVSRIKKLLGMGGDGTR
jgi:predicted flap endonuclease-1-like 5' DNA nuclease